MTNTDLIILGKNKVREVFAKPENQETIELYRKNYVSQYGGNPDYKYAVTHDYHTIPFSRAMHQMKMELLLEELQYLFGDCTSFEFNNEVFLSWPEQVVENIQKFLGITLTHIDLVLSQPEEAFMHFSHDNLSRALYLVVGALEHKQNRPN